MNKTQNINLLLEIDYYNKDVRSKLSWDKDDFVSYTKTMSEIEMKVFKKMITSELKPVTDYLNPVKVKKPKLDQGTRSESAKDELIEVLKTENTQLKARVAELEAEIVELKAEIVELKAENARLKAINEKQAIQITEQSNQITELMAMNKTLLARLDLK